MEDTALKQPTMVSRLPKFGSRATPVPGPITNGSTHNVSSGWAKGVPLAKQNGMVRVAAPFPGKGRKGREDCGEKVPDCREEVQAVVRSQLEPRSVVRQIRKPSAAPVGKTQRSTPAVPSTIPRNAIQPIKTNPRNTVPKQPSLVQPSCSRIGVTVAAVRENSSSSSQGSLQSSLSHSSDSIKSISVENVVRSQSFSYLKRPEATTDPPLTRSFSFNRATELAKQLPRPLAQSPVARYPVTQTSMVLDHVTKPTIPTCSVSSIPPSTFKKSLLPGATNGKPSLLSYKLMRSSINSQPRPVLPVKGKMELPENDGDSREKATPVSEPSSNTHSAGTPTEERLFNTEVGDGHGHCLEILEDMSLSSTSSLERNDVSEEYMDDFDDLGNGILLMSVHDGKKDGMGFFKEGSTPVYCQMRSPVTSPHSFMSESVDWTEIGLTGSRKLGDVSHGCGPRALCAERDLQHGSSLELSPSDSSGGTYMWDEEVLEPIGQAARLCESFDSNLNSMDVLNNVDSCDLEEDDLMLDVDLPEDVSLHSDVDIAPRYDQLKSDYWSWRKTRQCRGETEQLHYQDRDGALQPFDNGHTLSLSRRESGHSSLDELMLKHMAQDCTSVKEQLFHLRTLLQMEKDGSVDEAEQLVSSSSSEAANYQVDELLQELQKLRAELREKDTLIYKLTQQLSAPVEVTPCECQQGALQRAERQDSSTQTAWREHTPQILQPSERSRLGRASCRVSSEVHGELLEAQPADGPVKLRFRSVNFPVAATLPFSVPVTASAVSAAAASSSSCTPNSDNLLLLNSRFHLDETHNPRAPVSNCVQLRTNQQSVLLKPRGGPQPGFSAPSRTRHLPPPSQSSLMSTTRSANIRTVSAPKHEPQDLTNTCTSRLPKPKSH